MVGKRTLIPLCCLTRRAKKEVETPNANPNKPPRHNMSRSEYWVTGFWQQCHGVTRYEPVRVKVRPFVSLRWGANRFIIGAIGWGLTLIGVNIWISISSKQ